jgi:hypothetical protein
MADTHAATADTEGGKHYADGRTARAATGETPDVRVHYHASVNQKVDEGVTRILRQLPKGGVATP